MIEMRHCPHWSSAVAEGMKMTDGNYQDSHRSMFITPLQCRIFKQGSEHFQRKTLFTQVLDPKQVWRDGYYFVPPFVVSRTRDPDPPVFRAVPLALHLISHSLGNERSWSMTERPYCIPILNSYGLRNDRSRSRVAPVDYLDFLSAPVVGTVPKDV